MRANGPSGARERSTWKPRTSTSTPVSQASTTRPVGSASAAKRVICAEVGIWIFGALVNLHVTVSPSSRLIVAVRRPVGLLSSSYSMPSRR